VGGDSNVNYLFVKLRKIFHKVGSMGALNINNIVTILNDP